jgi:hypothetical protein
MAGSLVNNELKWTWKEEVVADLRYYPGISVEGLQKIMKTMGWNSGLLKGSDARNTNPVGSGRGVPALISYRLISIYVCYNMKVRFEVLTAEVMKGSIFWAITPFSSLKVNLRYGGTCLHLQGQEYAE